MGRDYSGVLACGSRCGGNADCDFRILLFHNELANTTEALPEILSNLKSQGYKFVTVSELIYQDNYTIDANGVQHTSTDDAAKISDEKINQVFAQYSAELSALGLSDEDIEQAKQALKSGDLSALPKELQPVAQRIMASVTKQTTNSDTPSNSTVNSTSSSS